MQSNYLISPITTWDDEKQLYGTDVAINSKTMALHYTVWHKDEGGSRQKAERLGEILTNHENKKD